MHSPEEKVTTITDLQVGDKCILLNTYRPGLQELIGVGGTVVVSEVRENYVIVQHPEGYKNPGSYSILPEHLQKIIN